jgi:hypothetical protein
MEKEAEGLRYILDSSMKHLRELEQLQGFTEIEMQKMVTATLERISKVASRMRALNLGVAVDSRGLNRRVAERLSKALTGKMETEKKVPKTPGKIIKFPHKKPR